MKKIALFQFLVTAFGLNAQLCFNIDTSSWGSPPRPNCIITADFNGDGKPDIVTSNYYSSVASVSVLLGSGTGTFLAAMTYTTNGAATSLCSADFNLDGKQDVVVNDVTNNKVIFLSGNGSGGFSSSAAFGVGTDPNFILTDDFNNDGKPDVAAANFQSNNISVLLGNGSGSFTTGATLNSTNPEVLSTADFNLDGKMDIAATNYTLNCISVFLGSGSGSFGTASYITFTSGFNPGFVISPDINADGKPDLVTVANNNSELAISLGNGSGGFNAPAYIITPALAVCSGDFNGDGKADLANAYNYNEVSILPGTGSGNFGAASNFFIGTQPRSICKADFNADGKEDLATADILSSYVSVLLNCTVSGISNYNPLYTLKAYPDPANDRLLVECNAGLQGRELTLRNILGNTILKIKIHGSKEMIDIQNIENGVYFLSILMEQGFTERKIIIQH